MKRAYLLLLGSLLMVMGLAGLPRLVAAQSTSTPLNLTTEAWQRFQEQRRAGDVPPIGHPAETRPADAPLKVQAANGDWAWIAYQSYRDGNWEIYLSHDGQEYRLTTHSASDARPRLNRGATQIAFNSNRDGNYEIYTINVDGSNARRLTTDAGSDIMPAWSPDGTRLAFASNRTGKYQIYVVNADGSGLRRLTNSPTTDDVSPGWSPDGTRLAWVRESGNRGAIHIMNADGSNQWQMLSGQYYLSDAIWSPSGTQFALDYIPQPNYFPAAGVYVVNADGTGLHRMFDSGNMWVDFWAGSWSPDGGWIMYTRAEYAVYNNQVYLNASYIEYNNASWYYPPPRFSWTGLDMNPDWQTADLKPPVSSITPLPQYSRASGFTVEWSGIDYGPAGVGSYDLETRINGGPWTAWKSGTTETSATYAGSGGQTVAFRGRARDNAANLESWPTDSETSTTLYTWEITGSLRDTRGYPLPQATASLSPTAITPLATDVRGQLHGYLQATGLHTFTAASAGYGTSRPESIIINTDQNIGSFTLPPLDEQIINGGFEVANLNGWQPEGDPQPQTTTALKHTGQHSAVLGQPSEFSYDVPDELDLPTPVMTVDISQTTFLVSAGGTVTDGFTLTLMTSPITGTWSAVRTIMTSPHAFAAVVAAPDQLGGLYVLWYSAPPTNTDQLNGQLLTCHVPAEAVECDQPEILSEHVSLSSGGPRLVADRSGGLHAVWLTASPTFELHYAHRSAGGGWSSSEAVLSGARWPDLAVDAAQTVYLVSVPLSSVEPQVMQKASGGAWLSPEALPFGLGSAPLLAVAPDGTQHVVVFNTNDLGLYYGTRVPGGSWAVSQMRGVQEYAATPVYLGVSDAGVAHLIYRGAMWGTWLSYIVRTPDGIWHATTDGWNIENTWVAAQLDGQGIMHLGWRWPGDTVTRYTQTTVAQQPIDYMLTQTVTIPAEAHRPTFDLWYRLENTWQRGANRLVIDVNDGSVISEALNVSATALDWTSSWADLSAWTGKTVTISVKLRQAAGSPFAQVQVDDVSLGSWRTPVVQAVSVNHLPAWTAMPITLSGLNFIDSPTVQIGSLVITSTEWVDAQTISLTVPALGPGFYPLLVYNPGGQTGRLSFDLPVGQQVYLPLLRR